MINHFFTFHFLFILPFCILINLTNLKWKQNHKFNIAAPRFHNIPSTLNIVKNFRSQKIPLCFLDGYQSVAVTASSPHINNFRIDVANSRNNNRTFSFGLASTAPSSFQLLIRLTDGQGTTKTKLSTDFYITVNVVDPGYYGYASYDQISANRLDIFLPKFGLNIVIGPMLFVIGIAPNAASRYLNNVQGLCGSNFDRNSTNDLVNPVTGNLFAVVSTCNKPSGAIATQWANTFNLRTYSGQIFRTKIPEYEAMRVSDPMELQVDVAEDLPVVLDSYDELREVSEWIC